MQRTNKILSAKNLILLADLCSKWWRIYASVKQHKKIRTEIKTTNISFKRLISFNIV